MTLNNWEMIAETQNFNFKWRSRILPCRVCLNSLISVHVVEWRRMRMFVECTKTQNARAKRAKVLFCYCQICKFVTVLSLELPSKWTGLLRSCVRLHFWFIITIRCTLVRSLMAISLGLFSDLCEDKIWPLISSWHKPWKFMKSMNRLKSKFMLGFGQRSSRSQISARDKRASWIHASCENPLESRVSRGACISRPFLPLVQIGSTLSQIGLWGKPWNTKITLIGKETHSTKRANQIWDILVGGNCSQQSTDCLLIIIIAIRDLCKARNLFNLT